MGVIKRKSKTTKNGYLYEVNFTYKVNGVTQRHFKRGFTSKKEAELYEIEKKNEIRLNGSLKKEVKITLNQAFKEFIELGSGQYQLNTIYNSKKDYHYFKDNIGKLLINEISYNDLQSFFNDRINQGIETNKNIRKTLNRVFVYSIRAGYIKDNPLRYVIVKGEDRTRKKEVLSFFNFNLLIEKLYDKQEFRYYAYAVAIIIGYYTGLRVSEALSLDKCDFDFENDLIDIDKKLVFKGLKKTDYYATKQMKSKKSRAKIPLPLILKNILLQWFKFNPYDKVVCDKDGCYINPTCLSNEVKKIANEYGMHFNFHMLRHTYATNLAKNKVDIKVAQELMRHDNFNTTLSFYTHIDDNQKKQAVNDVFKMDCGEFVANGVNKNESPKQNPLYKGNSK